MFTKTTSLKFAIILSCFLLLSFSRLMSAAPHMLSGSVTIAGTGAPANGSVVFECYLVDYPEDILHYGPEDNVYEDGYYWVQCADFQNAWTAGMVIHINMQEVNGGSASSERILTNESSDNMDIILLGSSLSPNHVIFNCNAFLDGAYQTGTDGMSIILNTQGVIPLESPYADHRIVEDIPANVVDWIYIELRSAPAAAPTAGRSFFLRNDGVIVDADCATVDLQINGVEMGYYFIVLNHRNHMVVMSANSLYLSP